MMTLKCLIPQSQLIRVAVTVEHGKAPEEGSLRERLQRRSFATGTTGSVGVFVVHVKALEEVSYQVRLWRGSRA